MNTRRYVATVVLLSLAACGPAPAGDTPGALAFDTDADARACESYIMATLDMPESYRRLSLTRTDQPVSADAMAAAIGEFAQEGALRIMIDDIWAEKGIKLRELKIESADGENTRRTDVCRFAIVGEKLAEQFDPEHLAQFAIEAYERRDMARNGLVPGIPPEQVEAEPEFPCCLPR